MGKRSKPKPAAPAPEVPDKTDFLKQEQEARKKAGDLRRSTLFAGKNPLRSQVETLRPSLLGQFNTNV
jgi:hypothetical protein